MDEKLNICKKWLKKRQRVLFQVKGKLVKNENEGMYFKCKFF